MYCESHNIRKPLHYYDQCVCCSTQAILQVVDKIPTIGTQLKIIAAVKATRQGGDGECIYSCVFWKECVSLSIPGLYVLHMILGFAPQSRGTY